MSVRSVKTRPARKPPSPSKPRKLSLSAERLEQIIAERAGVRPNRVAVRGSPENWDAVLIVNPVGNAERRAVFWSIVRGVKDEFDLSD